MSESEFVSTGMKIVKSHSKLYTMNLNNWNWKSLSDEYIYNNIHNIESTLQKLLHLFIFYWYSHVVYQNIITNFNT